jgi:hypothetical protein
MNKLPHFLAGIVLATLILSTSAQFAPPSGNNPSSVTVGTNGVIITPTNFWTANGSNWTNIDASKITLGTLDDARLSTNILTISSIGGLVQAWDEDLDNLAAGDGSGLTNVMGQITGDLPGGGYEYQVPVSSSDGLTWQWDRIPGQALASMDASNNQVLMWGGSVWAPGTVVLPGTATNSGLTMSTARLLGRTTASSGAVEEISVGSGLVLAGGTLSGTGTTTNQTVTAPTGTNLTVDWASGNYAAVSLASASGTNVAVTLTNGRPGLLLFLQVTQGTTNRNLVFPAGTTQSLGGGATWTGSGTNKVDLVTLVNDGTNYRILGTSPDHN